MEIHFIFDLLAYLTAISLSLFVFKHKEHPIKDETQRYIYFTFVIVGFVMGAIIFSTINNYLTLGKLILGKSILGAIFGGIIFVEVYKLIYKIQGSTGAYFVPSLAIGIVIGRIGCFLAGMDDFTYGTQTDSPFAYDFGDGVLRHPVQLYESFLLLIFFIFTLVVCAKNRSFFTRYIFHIFVIYYATERFFIEFLKPYETIIGPLNIFQLICISLLLYAIITIRTSYRLLRTEV